MTTPDSGNDILGALLIQISGHAERLAALDERGTARHQEIAGRLEGIASDLTALAGKTAEAETKIARHGVILTSLNGLDAQVATLASQLADLAAAGRRERDGYEPVPAPRWWKLTGAEREAALDRLRAWVEQIYKPSYGHLAATLPECWEQHPFCLHTLDWLSELWSLLYLNEQRDARVLAAQAEWHTRLLPAAAEQMGHEANGCAHGRAVPKQWPTQGTHPLTNGGQAYRDAP